MPTTHNVPRWTPSPTQDITLNPRSNIDDSTSTHRHTDTGIHDYFHLGDITAPPHVLHQRSSNRKNRRYESDNPIVADMYKAQDSIRKDRGILITWQDLCVSVDVKGGNVPILSGLNGFARPGEILSIMGPSGCGKSTLLDTLAGRLGSGVNQTGEILINGRHQKLAFGTSAYVTQDDVLLTTLTVREVVFYSAQLQLPDSMPLADKRRRAEETIEEMGLTGAADTIIGGWAHKGISGGQKRRVSICIEILTRPELLFLDEPTSGLDSAASYHVMNRIARLAMREGMTVVAAIHQPSSKVFELFHQLCLLAYGKTIYFGAAKDTNEFFASNGFPCQPLRNPPDHFLRTINRDFDKDESAELAKTTSATHAIQLLVDSYKISTHAQEVLQQITEIRQVEGATVSKGAQASFQTQSLVLTRRSFVNMYRDKGYYWLRLTIFIALSICVGTIFYSIGHSYGSIQARGSLLRFIALFLTFMAIGGFPSFVEDMKVFHRERLNGHYGVGSFVIANSISAIPYLALISIVPAAIAYYLTGLQRSLDHFAYFTLLLFITVMLVEGLMMIVASIVPDFLMGIITGAGIQGVMMLTGGFRLPNDLPKPIWRYPMYYISFYKYTFQGLIKNELLGMTFPNNQAGGAPTISGEEICQEIWEVEMHNKWIDFTILLGMAVLYRMLFFMIVKITDNAKPVIKGWQIKVPKELTKPDSMQTPLGGSPWKSFTKKTWYR